MGSSAVALAVVLLPGLAAWWTGRRLIPLRDDPALPERLMSRRTRLAQAAGICWAGQFFVPGGGLWLLAHRRDYQADRSSRFTSAIRRSSRL